MLKLGNLEVTLDGNTFAFKADIPFIPPSKMEYKDKYEPFNGTVRVEKDRLLKLYEILDDALNGKFIDKTFILNEDTQRLKAILLTPPNLLSDNARKKGAVYALNVSQGKLGITENIKTARVLLSYTLINLLKRLIKEHSKMAYTFYEVDEEGKLHNVVIERDKGKIKVIHPVEVELSPTKHSKLQITVNSYLNKADKVPTTIVASQIVFRKNTNGDFAIHTPYHSVNIREEDVRKLKLLVDD